ncbi:MAG: hypothetical protein KF753_23615 [Caldilineaceae bacterium]|nr:hypothetical protein [Caldilineaceae bacterium]
MPLWSTVDAQGTLRQTGAPPAESRPFLQATGLLLPPLISELHQSFHAWQVAGLAPGPVTLERLWITPAGGLSVRFADGEHPRALPPVGAHAGLAAWLVLLDKWVETFVVVARARSVWTPGELAGALSFTTPSLLPATLMQTPPDNWEQVAIALARAVAEGPLPGTPTNRHWSK